MGFLSNISNAVRRIGRNSNDNRTSDAVPTLVPYNEMGWRLFGNSKIRPCKSYKDVIFFQFVKMIGVLFNDVELTYIGNTDREDFDKFVAWFNRYAFITWNFICMNGCAVVVQEYTKEGDFVGFKTLKLDEFDWEGNKVRTKSSGWQKPFVMTSDVFDCVGTSDFSFVGSYLALAEKYLNNSDLAIDGNGHIIFVSPESENNHTSTVLDEKQREEWEKDFKKSYANFRDDWVNPYFSNRPLTTTDIDLTNFDTANFDKLIKVMLVICGHFDLPANQVPILETSASKGLTTGNELRIGDSLKYKTFERILQWFVVDCANFYNIPMTYTINNDPNNNTSNTERNEN